MLIQKVPLVDDNVIVEKQNYLTARSHDAFVYARQRSDKRDTMIMHARIIILDRRRVRCLIDNDQLEVGEVLLSQ
jgi:hypothetical protein